MPLQHRGKQASLQTEASSFHLKVFFKQEGEREREGERGGERERGREGGREQAALQYSSSLFQSRGHCSSLAVHAINTSYR